MSTLDAARRQLRRIEKDERPSGSRWVGAVALLSVLMAAIVGAAQAQVLPGFSADDAGSITYQAAGLPMVSANR